CHWCCRSRKFFATRVFAEKQPVRANTKRRTKRRMHGCMDEWMHGFMRPGSILAFIHSSTHPPTHLSFERQCPHPRELRMKPAHAWMWAFALGVPSKSFKRVGRKTRLQ